MSDGIEYDLVRFRTRDGYETTVYLVRHPAARTRVSVVRFDEPTRLDLWCAANRHPEAMVDLLSTILSDNLAKGCS